MAVSFTIKTITPGRGSTVKKVKNDKLAAKTIKQEIEYTTGKVVIKVVDQAIEMANQRKLFTAAIFFQWVVARTPFDEVYQKSNGDIHEPDDDVIRNDWYIAYGNKKFCSKDFVGCFDDFNDSSAINKIAKALSEGIKTKRNIRTIRIYNTNEKFEKLEYGKYKYDSKEIHDGQWGRKHGVEGGFSVQAPKGMLRLTEMELTWIAQHLSKSKSLLASAEFMRKVEKAKAIPDKRRINAMFNYLKNKRKIKESDIGWLK